MVKMKKCVALIIFMLFTMLITFNSVTLSAFAAEKVEVSFVGVDHSPLVVGDEETFYLTSKNADRVQYKVFISDKEKEEWTEITESYTEVVDAKVPYAVKYPGKFKKGKYKLLVHVRKEGSTNDYDNTYIFYMNCVDRDDNNRVYANGEVEFLGEKFSSEEDTYIVGEKIKLKGIKSISGMKAPYTFKLHIFDTKEGKWMLDDKTYREDVEWIPEKPGVYVLDLWAMSSNSTLWPKFKKDPKAKLYEAWKMKVITVKDIDQSQYLKLPLNESFSSLDSSNIDSSTLILTDVMEGLTRLENYGEKSIAKSAAAEKWEASKDGLTWNFHLRDFYWSDGEKVTARDYEYAWKRTLSTSANASLLYVIKGAEKYSLGQAPYEEVGIKAIDDKTLQVKLQYPIPNFDQLVSTIAYLPQRQDIVEKYGEKYGDIAFNFVSNGPFVISSWDKGKNIELKKNAKYWDENSVKLETITFNLNESDDSQLAKFKNKELDIVMGGEKLFQELQVSNDKKLYLEASVNSSLIDYTLFNIENKNNKLTSNDKVRLALSIAINRENYCKEFTQYKITPAYGLIPKDIQNGGTVYRNMVLEPLEVYKNSDPKKLFDQGVKELNIDINKPMEMTYLIINGQEDMKKSAEFIKKQWEDILGIKVNIVSCSFTQFVGRLYEGDFDAAQLLCRAQYNDPLAMLDIFTLNNGLTYNWVSSEYDKVVENIRNEADMSKRMLLIKQAENMLIEKAIIAPLSYKNNKIYLNNYLRGIMYTRNSIMDFKYAYTAGR